MGDLEGAGGFDSWRPLPTATHAAGPVAAVSWFAGSTWAALVNSERRNESAMLR